MPETPAAVVGRQFGAFLRQGVSIIAASCASGRAPKVSRAVGCRVQDNGCLLLYLPTARSVELLEAISASQAIAVIFCEVQSHKTIQLKGEDATLCPMPDNCADDINRYTELFTAALVALDYEVPLAHALVKLDPTELTCVVFTPSAVFDQTPGPGAGSRLVPA